MTEEIIIDGVDVAGCVRLQDNKISCDLGGECKGWDNCYYKQLKRLEQENKTNLKQIELDVEHICRLNKQIERLEQENKELKEKLDKEEYNACCECTNIQNQNDKYRSALEEIKQNMKNASKATIEEEAWKEFRKAMNKINEVLQCE